MGITVHVGSYSCIAIIPSIVSPRCRVHDGNIEPYVPRYRKATTPAAWARGAGARMPHAAWAVVARCRARVLECTRAHTRASGILACVHCRSTVHASSIRLRLALPLGIVRRVYTWHSRTVDLQDCGRGVDADSAARGVRTGTPGSASISRRNPCPDR